MRQKLIDLVYFFYQKYWDEIFTRIRLFPYRLFGLKVGSHVRASSGLCLSRRFLRRITIGNNVSLGSRGCISIERKDGLVSIGDGTMMASDFFISSDAPVHIGRDCLFSFRVSILGHAHPVGWGIKPVTSGYEECAPTSIGDGCSIGCNSTIMPGVSLGDYCVVGANSVVMNSFPPGSVIAGVPAKLLRSLNENHAPT